ncbi:hypothetical protein [Pseudonocardia terrae]|uniref:hypothetical protein n=1 Tax=Pseudonocardia terrae TaxID=2905831 RepID=UPI0027E0B8D8|nr:hypothetical protein [Pseudonocardia terrae]
MLLRDDSCHNRWVSSAALAAAGIDADAPDPADGTIVRDPATRRPGDPATRRAGRAAHRVGADPRRAGARRVRPVGRGAGRRGQPPRYRDPALLRHHDLPGRRRVAAHAPGAEAPRRRGTPRRLGRHVAAGQRQDLRHEPARPGPHRPP